MASHRGPAMASLAAVQALLMQPPVLLGILLLFALNFYLRAKASRARQTQSESQEDRWQKVAHVDEVPKESMREVDVMGAGEAPKSVGKLLLTRSAAGEFHAVGNKCTHYGASLSTGVLCGNRVTCPWHAACFNVETGDIEDGCAVDALPTYDVKVEGDDVLVKVPPGRLPMKRTPDMATASAPRTGGELDRIVIIGTGAAGFAAAQTLREENYTGEITMITNESVLPYDRVKLSKSLGGEPKLLRPQEFYERLHIEVLLNESVTSVDTTEHCITIQVGDRTDTIEYTSLLCATGGFPRLFTEEQARFHRGFSIPGTDLPGVFTVRQPSDTELLDRDLSRFASRESRGPNSARVVIIGSSFIGMEVAAYLAQTKRVQDVTVLGMENEPFEAVLGSRIGQCMRRMHEELGNVKFLLPCHVKELTANREDRVGHVIVDDGERLDCDLVIMATGVIPATQYLDESAGIELSPGTGGGVVVDEYLCASENVYCAGDIAAFPYWAGAGEPEVTRVEHWAVAIEQGRVAARNMLGQHQKYRTIPFFWTQQYGAKIRIRYAGHAHHWDEQIFQFGTPNDESFVCYFVENDVVTAVVTLNKDPWAVAACELLRLGKMPPPVALRGADTDLPQFAREVGASRTSSAAAAAGAT